MVGCHSIDKVYLVVQEMDKVYLVFSKVTKCTLFFKKVTVCTWFLTMLQRENFLFLTRRCMWGLSVSRWGWLRWSHYPGLGSPGNWDWLILIVNVNQSKDLEEIDFHCLFFQGHLNQDNVKNLYKSQLGQIDWWMVTSMNLGMLRAKESRVTGTT